MVDPNRLGSDAMTPEQYLEKRREIMEGAVGSLASADTAAQQMEIFEAQNPAMTAVFQQNIIKEEF